MRVNLNISSPINVEKRYDPLSFSEPNRKNILDHLIQDDMLDLSGQLFLYSWDFEKQKQLG